MQVDCKRAMPLGDYGIESHVTTTRLWIGGVNETTTEEAIREHFSQVLKNVPCNVWQCSSTCTCV